MLAEQSPNAVEGSVFAANDQDVKVVSVGSTGALLRWGVPAVIGGTITNFKVETALSEKPQLTLQTDDWKTATGDGPFTDVVNGRVVGGRMLVRDLTGATAPPDVYVVRVTANNAYGTGTTQLTTARYASIVLTAGGEWHATVNGEAQRG